MDLVIGLVIAVAVVALVLRWSVARWWARRSRSRQSQPQSRTTADIVAVQGNSSPASLTPASGNGAACWIGPGQRVAIGNVAVNRGLFYLGRSLPTVTGYGTENALVDPTLPLARSPGNLNGHGIPYYPSYASLDAASRRTYVEWLASARDNPVTYIGYVFLYFYGLERRLFIDNAASDHGEVIAEVERLLSVYGANRSFQMYATALLDAAAAMTNQWPSRPSIDPSSKPSEIPLRLRGAIGAMLRGGQPITFDWALAWYVASPEFSLRTPAVRCFREFYSLFQQRFQAKFPRGLPFRAPRRNLSVRYRAASGTFTATLRGEFESLPDIVSLTAPLSEVDRVVTDCTEALEPYSRLIGRDPSARGTLAAELSLPKELLQRPQTGGAVAQTRQQLETIVPKSSAMVSLDSLMSLLKIRVKSDNKNSKSETVAVAAALENLGFAMEPDPRYGGPVPARDAEVMVFRHNGQPLATAAVSPAFLAARTQVEISVLVASSDAAFDDDEARAVIGQIRAMSGLDELQRLRLFGYLGYLVRNPPNVRTVARFKERSLDERKVLVDRAVSSAAANGHLDVTEIKVLEKTYKTLGFSKDELYRNLHELGAQADEPPIVAHGTPARGVPIPPQKPIDRPQPTGITLDKNRVAKIQAETTAVKSILDQVFNEPAADEEPEALPVTRPIATSDPTLEGLDARHASLLNEIISRDVIEQAKFAELARKHGLLADGAIEAINEWSFERFEEALLDNGEPIEIARHLFHVPQPEPSSLPLSA